MGSWGHGLLGSDLGSWGQTWEAVQEFPLEIHKSLPSNGLRISSLIKVVSLLARTYGKKRRILGQPPSAGNPGKACFRRGQSASNTGRRNQSDPGPGQEGTGQLVQRRARDATPVVESVGAVAASSRRQVRDWKINRRPELAPLFPAILP